MAQITDSGYVLKTQNEYFEEQEQLYKDIDPDWNTDPSTPDGLKLAADSEALGNLDELLMVAYHSKDPNKATGNDLDILYSLLGITRQPGTPSTVVLTLTGDYGTVVPAGSVIESTENGSRWETDTVANIGISGSITVAATCDADGPTAASAEALTKIVNPISGWQSVTNDDPATPGTTKETDAEFRLRARTAVAFPGNNQVDSMHAAIAEVEGVRRVKIYENDTDSVDGNGLPAHSIAPIVDGGTDAAVALAIYQRKNPGVAQHQAATAVSEVVESPVTGNTKTIEFSRPTYVDITLVINVTDDGTLPAGVDGEITQAVLDYVDGTLIDEAVGFNQRGFDIAEDVPAGRLYTPVNKVLGSYGGSYVSSLTVNAGSSVAIAFNELARFTEGNITVNIT